jgi:predicted MPP superfamily phosphohydrolase
MLVEVEVVLPRLPLALDGLVIAQLSDIHVGPSVGMHRLGAAVDVLAAAIEERRARFGNDQPGRGAAASGGPPQQQQLPFARQARPAFVVLTGDLLDGDEDAYAGGLAPLARLGGMSASGRVYGCSGNHDHIEGSWPRKMAVLERLGVTVLQNQRAAVPEYSAAFPPPPVAIGSQPGDRGVTHDNGGSDIGGERDASVPAALYDVTFDLVGVPDWAAAPMSGPQHASNMPAALQGRDPLRELVVLAHQPKHVFQSGGAGAGLQLSGHVHGGQVVPLQLPVWLGNPYFAGLYAHATPLSADASGRAEAQPAPPPEAVAGAGAGHAGQHQPATAVPELARLERALLRGAKPGPSAAAARAPGAGAMDSTSTLSAARQWLAAASTSSGAPSWRTWIYVSRGTLYWGPPMRLGAQHEVTLVTLRSAAAVLREAGAPPRTGRGGD